MGHGGDLQGTPVSEEHVALALGFKDVYEMRRWNTEQGQKVSKLEDKLREVKGDAQRFQWNIKRMMCVLEKVENHLLGNTELTKEQLILAVGVVTGKAVDWGNTLDWLKDHD